MLAPSAFTQTINGDAYASARLIASKKCGVLRFTPAVLAFSAVLTVAGLSVIFGHNVRTFDLLVKGLMALVTALCCAAAVLMILPERIRQQAKRDFDVFDALSNPVTVTMREDDMTVTSAVMSRRIEYAKVKYCVETNDCFTVITDDDRCVILDISCFTDKEQTVLFFRDVFARCYSKG